MYYPYSRVGVLSKEVSKLPRATQLIRAELVPESKGSVIHPKDGWVWRSDELK